MKKIFFVLSLMLFLTSCSVTLPVNATSNQVGDKVGMSKATGYLNFIWIGQDASIQMLRLDYLNYSNIRVY